MIGLLGSGGMAQVYLARDLRLQVDVALKVLTIPSPVVGQRLQQEGRLQARLQHPNVLPVTDLVEIGGYAGLVMERVRGPSLAQLLAHRKLDMVEKEYLVRGIVEGVQAAHHLGLVHRDLKPANVLIARAGQRLVPKVADFGLAKVLGDDVTSQTVSGIVMGSPAYMAPEQIRSAKGVDARADIFSLGAIIYEVFCGLRAFKGGSSWRVLNAVMSGGFTPPADLGIALPRRIEAVILDCLVVNRDDRIASCEELLERLDQDGG
ncbi:MAG: serine/threonine protein kinase, partial [Proteobacteria bacterium]|nr:serine/threonine protein kinase [Pseudomonadota bacterium]